MTVTASEKVTVTGTTWPVPYVPSARVEETPAAATAGTVVSIVIDRFPDAELALPATSVCIAFMEWEPEVRTDEVIVTVPDEQVPVPTDVDVSRRVTVAPDSQDIVKAGVVSDVILSVEDEPVSVAEVISGVPGALATLSIVMDRFPDAAD